MARATFHIIAGENETIGLEELEELFEGWGLPDKKAVAKQVFENADHNSDGVIGFEEFQEHLWFIWERIRFVGEAETRGDGSVQRTQIESISKTVQKKSLAAHAA